MWYRLYTLVRKELAALLRNPQSRGLLIVPVLLQLALFPFAATLEVRNSHLAVFNQDGGAASIELVERLAATRAFPYIEMARSDAELARLIDRQEVLLAIRIPRDFSRRLAAGRGVSLQAIIDGRRSNSAQIAYGYAGEVVRDFTRERYAGTVPATLVTRHLYNPNLDYRWFVLPSLVAIITTIGCLMVTALSLAREKEEGTFEQLLVTPLTPAFIMAGKAVPGVLVALVQGGIIALAAVWVYRVPFTGPVWLLLASMIAYGLSLIGFGLLISALSSNQQQAFLGSFAFMSPAVILSGYMAPVENMPPVLRALSAIDPLRHFIVIVKGIFLKGYGAGDVWPHAWPLLAIAAVTLGCAYLLFLRRSGSL
ncbi:ABC transporter permease [Paludibacterium paludis]|uniref:Transport permease protein n=1 Tax=Paludibacterium paludis TaxID=1225769 RepID=A0A918P449_9NEIS|nr:ABC transporter permease [Paludibacterium paludis]GGY19841.1 transport permease protein [Paludibacterium paludis]